MVRGSGLKQDTCYSLCNFKSYSVGKNTIAAISGPSLAILRNDFEW